MKNCRHAAIRCAAVGLWAAAWMHGCTSPTEGEAPYTPTTYAAEQNSAALEAMRAGDFEQALEMAGAAVADDPDFREARCNQANILGRMGRLEEAAELLAEVTRRWPDFGQALVFEGIYLERLGEREAARKRYASAVETFEAEIAGANPAPETMMHLAVAEFLLRGKVAGIRIINDVVARYPNYTAAHLVRRRIAEGDRDYFMGWTLEPPQREEELSTSQEETRKE